MLCRIEPSYCIMHADMWNKKACSVLEWGSTLAVGEDVAAWLSTDYEGERRGGKH
jgi:hypothetical protein